MRTDLSHRVEQTLEALGLSARQASIEAGLSPDTLGKVIGGKTRSLRGDNLVKVAKILGVSPTWLASGFQEGESPPLDENSQGEPFGGVVEAGSFRPVDLLDQTENRRIMVERDIRYPRGQYFVYEVRGDSMDAVGIVEGFYILAMDMNDWSEWYGGLRDGMFVIVRAIRNGGHEFELTVKELRIYPEKMVLIPRSSNPKHKAVEYHHGAVDEHETRIEIIAVVTKLEKLFGK